MADDLRRHGLRWQRGMDRANDSPRSRHLPGSAQLRQLFAADPQPESDQLEIDAGDNNVSSGSGGQTSNSVAITYGTPSANWGLIWGCMVLDSATYGAGNPLFYFALTTPKTVNNGDAAPSFAIGALTNQIDN